MSFVLATWRVLIVFVALGRYMHVPDRVVVEAILGSRNALLVFEWMKGRDTQS